MILRKVIPILIACSCLPPIAAAQGVLPGRSTIPPSSTVEHTQDFSEIVVPITSVKIIPSAKLGIKGKLGPKLDVDAKFGTGFCLDASCRFIATNYHVAVTACSQDQRTENRQTVFWPQVRTMKVLPRTRFRIPSATLSPSTVFLGSPVMRLPCFRHLSWRGEEGMLRSSVCPF